MNFLSCKLLIEEELGILKHNLNKQNEFWESGKKTAGSHASKVKENLQLNRNSELSKKYTQLIRKKIISNPLIKSFALPKMIHGIMFTKSLKNMHYGRHIDNPFMSSGRSDLSFTVSLTSKDHYQGGELVIETMNSEKELLEFVERLNSIQFKEVEKFFDTMPKLSHEIEVENPNTKVKSKVVLEGLASFFG